MEALGLIETKGLLSAIVAADIAVKSANVTLMNAERIKGGYVTVQLTGDVGAVKAAVSAATESITSFQTLVSSHVIPRMHEETTQLVMNKGSEKSQKDEPIKEVKEPEETKEIEDVKEVEQITEIPKKTEIEVQKPTENKKKPKVKKTFKRTELEKMTVNELRKLVREENVMKDDLGKIKYAKKAELINRLLINKKK